LTQRFALLVTRGATGNEQSEKNEKTGEGARTAHHEKAACLAQRFFIMRQAGYTSHCSATPVLAQASQIRSSGESIGHL